MLRAKILKVGEWLIQKNPWYFAPLSWGYAFVVFCRNKLYDYQILAITKVPATVVSVGNIVAGGTGKTPFVDLLARKFSHRKVAILSRGYGEMPDEAMLLAKRLPNVKVYVGKNRAALAKRVDAELLILDDGFQHRRLHRDFDIVLHNEHIPRTGSFLNFSSHQGDPSLNHHSSPISKQYGPPRDDSNLGHPEATKIQESTRARYENHYLPWGFLRDSPKRLKQAEVFFTKDLKLNVVRICDLKGNPIPSIRGWKVAIFCGIAHPQNFRQTVLDLGAEIIAEKYFADHELADLRKLPRVSALICTEKDAVKLPPTDLPIYYLEMEMELLSSKDRFEKLVEKIDQKIDNSLTYER